MWLKINISTHLFMSLMNHESLSRLEHLNFSDAEKIDPKVKVMALFVYLFILFLEYMIGNERKSKS